MAATTIGRASRNTSVQIGVNNVFNITPPLVYNAPPSNSAILYDFAGRMAHLRMSQQF